MADDDGRKLRKDSAIHCDETLDDENDKTWMKRCDEPTQKFWMSVCRPKCLDLTPIRFSNPTLTLLTHANIKRK